MDVAGHRTGFTGVYKAAKPGPVLVFLAHPWGKNPGADGAGSDRRSRVASADQGGSRESRQGTVKKCASYTLLSTKFFCLSHRQKPFLIPPDDPGGFSLQKKDSAKPSCPAESFLQSWSFFHSPLFSCCLRSITHPQQSGSGWRRRSHRGSAVQWSLPRCSGW